MFPFVSRTQKIESTESTAGCCHCGGRFAILAVMGLCIAALADCTVGGVARNETFPTLSGCPIKDIVIGESFTLTVNLKEGELLGATVVNVFPTEEVETMRTGPQSFTFTVTPREAGDRVISIAADTDKLVNSEERLECNFTVISNLGACCESGACELTDSNECFFRDGIFAGPGTICTDPQVDCGVCVIDENCPDDIDPCTMPFCARGACGQRKICTGDGVCDPANGDCPITINVPFPTTIQNGETVDLVVNWSSLHDTNFKKSVSFGPAVGTCPAGFGCPRKTLTIEHADPFTIPNAFTCRIDGATEPVPFIYEVGLQDANGLGSNIVVLGFTCVP